MIRVSIDVKATFDGMSLSDMVDLQRSLTNEILVRRARLTPPNADELAIGKVSKSRAIVAYRTRVVCSLRDAMNVIDAALTPEHTELIDL